MDGDGGAGGCAGAEIALWLACVGERQALADLTAPRGFSSKPAPAPPGNAMSLAVLGPVRPPRRSEMDARSAHVARSALAAEVARPAGADRPDPRWPGRGTRSGSTVTMSDQRRR